MTGNDPYYDPPEDDTAVKALRARALVEPLELPLPSRRPRWVVRGIVAGVLALFLLIVALAWYQYMGPDMTGEPVLVKADPEPYKIAPADDKAVLPGEAAAGTAITGGKLPEDRIEGEVQTAEPVAPTTPDASAPAQGPGDAAGPTEPLAGENGAAGNLDPAQVAAAQIEPAAPPQAVTTTEPPAAPDTTPPQAPVASVEVPAKPRDPNAIVADELPPPEGVVTSDAAPPLAEAPGSLAATAPEPPVAATAGATVEPEVDVEGPAISEIEPAPADETAPVQPSQEPEVAVAAPEAPVEPTVEPAVEPEAPVEQVVAGIQAPTGPIPSPRKPRRGQIAEQIALTPAAPRTAAAPAAPVEPQAGPAVANAAGGAPVWRVQVASLRDDASARRAWDTVRASHGEVLGGVTATIVRADISSGTVYRVQVGPFPSKASADAACAALKARRADCLTVGPIR